MNLNLLKSYAGKPASKIDVANPVNFMLLQAVEDYAHSAMKLGYFNPICSRKSLEQLSIMEVSKKLEITRFLRLCTQWVDNCEHEKLIVDEKSFLMDALDHYGLVVDDELFDTIDHDTVVEVYSENMIQLFRSFKLLDMTSYSLMDLSIFEWYLLWERPQLSVRQIQSEIDHVLKSEVPFKDFLVTPHVLKETFDTGLTQPFVPRSAFISLRHIGFLRPKKTGAPRAFISTGTGSTIAEGFADTSPLAFL